MKKSNVDVITLNGRLELVNELLFTKNLALTSKAEELKFFEGFVAGTTNVINRVDNNINLQKKESLRLLEQKSLKLESVNLIDIVLDQNKTLLQSLHHEYDKLLFSKTYEISLLKVDIDKLSIMQVDVVKKLKELEPIILVNPIEVVQEKVVGRPRVDKDPNTKIGRAAIDIAERRKKAQKNFKK